MDVRGRCGGLPGDGVHCYPGRLEELHAQLGTFTPSPPTPVVAGQLLDKYRPRTLVLNAGAAP
jgi:hypothetical protein